MKSWNNNNNTQNTITNHCTESSDSLAPIHPSNSDATMYSAGHQSSTTSESDECSNHFQFSWGEQSKSDLKIALPGIKTSITQSTIDSLYKYKRNIILYKILALVSILLFITSLILIPISEIFFSHSFKNIDTIIGILCFLSFIGICSMLAMYTCSYNKSIATFKNSIVLKELKQYIDQPTLQDNEYEFNHSSYSSQEIDDLTNSQSLERVLGALRLGNPSCNRNDVKEWIRGIYKGTSFIFFEAVLAYLSSSEEEKTTYFEGQGYIFRTVINMPFPIQYQYSNPQYLECTFENFNQIFTSGRIQNMSDGSTTIIPMSSLTAEEVEVFEIIEAPEFKACLLKLANIFNTLCKIEKLNNENHIISFNANTRTPSLPVNSNWWEPVNSNWCVQLKNKNLIIIRNGALNYFEINLNQEMHLIFEQFSHEMNEFISVLETVSSLALVDGNHALDNEASMT